MLRLSLVVLLTQSCLSTSAASTTSVFIADPLEPHAHTWSLVHPVPSHHGVSFTICLRQRNVEELFASALAVSTPSSDRYGKYWTPDEIRALTAPASADIEHVTAWLAAAGIRLTDISHRSECLQVDTSAGVASALLQTGFALHRREADGQLRIRAGGYWLPPRIHEAVATIHGLHGVPLPPPLPRGPVSGAANVTPAVLAATYHVGRPFVNRSGANVQAVAEFQNQFMKQEDLTAFFGAEVPHAQPGDDRISAFVGGARRLRAARSITRAHAPATASRHAGRPHAPEPCGLTPAPRGARAPAAPYKEGRSVEAALDVQYLMGVAPGVATEFWNWPAQDFCGDLANFSAALLAYPALRPRTPGRADPRPPRPLLTPGPRVGAGAAAAGRASRASRTRGKGLSPRRGATPTAPPPPSRPPSPSSRSRASRSSSLRATAAPAAAHSRARPRGCAAASR